VVHTDGEVVHHAKPHAGPERSLLGAFELFVADPLQPAVKPDPVREPFPERLSLRTSECAVGIGPERVPGRQVLPDGGPQRKVVKSLARDAAELVEGGLPGRRAAGMVEQLKCLQLGRVDGVAVQPVALPVQPGHLVVELLHHGSFARLEVRHFGDRLNADVQGIEEPPGGRRIR
jgi:hypothetical protein